MILMQQQRSPYVTVNPCRLCAPLGASLALKGIEGAITLIHGSQGCATYIRRYIISHFREPIDIASSSFTEETAIFGGGDNLKRALANVISKYSPSLIGIATTCLSETIGDDVTLWLSQFAVEHKGVAIPPIIHVSTPSYKGSHEAGYHEAVAAVIRTIAHPSESSNDVWVLPPQVSPADLRTLRHIVEMFGVPVRLLPDFSDTLDGGTWSQYHALSPGGTPLSALRTLGGARTIIEMGAGSQLRSAGNFLRTSLNRKVVRIPLPVGIRATGQFLALLSEISGMAVPDELNALRGRAADAYVDGHKYTFEKRAALFGDEDTVAALAGFCAEIGMVPAICATGGGTDRLKEVLEERFSASTPIQVLNETDYDTIEQYASHANLDLCIGTSKGNQLSRKLGIPLVRIGFPIHDRFGAGRLHMVGYEGAMELFDRVVNAILDRKQDTSDIGYSYL